MDRASFESFLLRHIWREGDTAMASDIPLIIRLGEGLLTRDLMVQQRLSNATLLDIGDAVIPFPTNYHALRALSDGDGAYSYATPHELAEAQAQGASGRVYTLTGEGIELLKPQGAPLAPVSLKASFYTTLPEYSDAETWVQRGYFDLYLYACLIHAAPYIREDDRVAEWEAFYDKTLAGVLADDTRRMYNGAPLKMRVPWAVG